METKSERSALCYELAKRQDFKCWYCDGKMTFTRRFPHATSQASLERLTPRSEGGGYTAVNTVAACQGCNNMRPIISPEEFQLVRKSLRTRWPALTKPSKEIRDLLKKEYGYHTGPIEVDIQSTVEQLDDNARVVE